MKCFAWCPLTAFLCHCQNCFTTARHVFQSFIMFSPQANGFGVLFHSHLSLKGDAHVFKHLNDKLELFSRISVSPSPSSKSYFPPQCRPKSHISEETARVLRILVFQGDSSTRSAQADIHKRSKGIKRFLPETVGALGGMLGDGVRVESVQPRVRC